MLMLFFFFFKLGGAGSYCSEHGAGSFSSVTGSYSLQSHWTIGCSDDDTKPQCIFLCGVSLPTTTREFPLLPPQATFPSEDCGVEMAFLIKMKSNLKKKKGFC